VAEARKGVPDQIGELMALVSAATDSASPRSG
jgi:hypothetical protein